MGEKIVVMGGSFNPPTIAHQRLLIAAVDDLGADKGVFVPSSHGYVSRKMKRAKQPDEVLPEEVRLRMLRWMCEEDHRLTVDDCEYHGTENAYTYETMETVQENNPQTELFFLAGGDKVSVIARWHRIREFLDRFNIIVAGRDGSDPKAEIRAHPFLSQYSNRFHVISAPQGLEGISSSAVREMLKSGNPAVETMLHPQVWKYLKERG